MESSAFAAELEQAMERAGIKQSQLGTKARVSQGMLSAWLLGKVSSPDPHKVFAVEKALDLPPGHLSRHLGFIPVPEKSQEEPLSFRDWLAQHGQDLRDDEQDALLGVYEIIRGRQPEPDEAPVRSSDPEPATVAEFPSPPPDPWHDLVPDLNDEDEAALWDLDLIPEAVRRQWIWELRQTKAAPPARRRRRKHA